MVGTGAVVVGVDGTEASERAARWAARQAVAFDRPLLLVYGMRWPVYTQAHLHMPVPVEFEGQEPMRAWARDMLDALAERCRALGPTDVRTGIIAGDPADAVILGADDAAFVVVGHSDSGGVGRLLLGSTALRLTRSCPWPVVVVREAAVVSEPVDGPVVVGVDGSSVSGAAVRFAFDFAARHDAEVVVMHAADRLGATTEVTRAEGLLGGGAVGEALADGVRRGVHARLTTTTAAPVDSLLAAADGARLLVVGSHGKGALSRAFAGSVSHAVVNHAPCPVAVLPPETARATSRSDF